MTNLWHAVEPLTRNPLIASLVTLIFSVLLTPFIATHFSLRAFRAQSKELVDAAVTWQWVRHQDGSNGEEPFLAVQNRSQVSAFVIQGRFLKGVFFRRQADRYAFAFFEITEGSFPLEVKPAGVTSFPLSWSSADRIAERAPPLSRLLAYALKRPYIWLEIRTLSGSRMAIPANQATSFQDRALWLQGRWLPEPIPEWMRKR